MEDGGVDVRSTVRHPLMSSWLKRGKQETHGDGHSPLDGILLGDGGHYHSKGR